MNEPLRIEGSAQTLRPDRLPGRRAQPPTADLLLDRFRPMRPLTHLIRFAPQQTLLYVLRAQESPSGEEVGKLAGQLRDATHRQTQDMGMEPRPLFPQGRQRALLDAGELLKEVGLEHLDTDVKLGIHRDGGEVIVAQPL